MKKTIIFSLLIVLTAFAFSSCKKTNNSHIVKYTTESTANETVTYTDQNGNTQTVTDAPANWSLSFTTIDNGMTAKLTAVSVDGSNVSGRIYIDATQSAQSNGISSSISLTALVP